ncbi:hypothetical protein PMI02_04644 [Novosphingobium sp. AP12]|nr:hypothetical protein PMI02_04644 [Novosphingobium sp. AP12]
MRTLVLVVPLLLCLKACSNPLCSNETVKSLRSPTGKHEAKMFMRECGATTDFTTQVSVDPWFWQGIGNAFVADGYNGGTRGAWGGPWADMKWTGPNELLVTHDQQARIFDRKEVVGSVTITYRPKKR